jgi:hypothetical protein
MTHLELLREIIGNLQRTPLKPGPIGLNDLAQAGLAHGRFNLRTLEVTGLTTAGMRAIGELALSLQANNPDLNRTASREKISEVLFNIVLDDFLDFDPTAVTPEHLAQLMDRLRRWAATHRVNRLHLIGCLIAPRDCGAFAVGPVRFFHLSQFDERRKGWAAQYSDAPDLAYEPFLREMAQSGAHYIAQVEVQDRESARSADIADLTVDLALSGLQLIFPRKESRHFARVSGRRFSPGRDDLVISKDGVQAGGQNRSPGLMLLPEQLQLALTHGSKVLMSIGNRLDAFLGHRTSSLPQLERTWCDAAYWMHEGFAESIDTIAVAKLETALEVLMSAESTIDRRINNAIMGVVPQGEHAHAATEGSS